MQTGLFNTAINIFYCILISCDNMKISANLNAPVPNGVWDILKIINCKFLWYHINDLIAGGYVCFILVIDELINFFLCDLLISSPANNIAPCLQTFNMVTGDTN